MEETRPYRYSPLPTSTAIRLVSSISASASGILHLTLACADLTELPRYDALSCARDSAWFLRSETMKLAKDSTCQTCHVLCNGQTLELTENLWLALNRLCGVGDATVDDEPLLWVDSICVDYDNPSEREQHVGLADKIFRQAQRVVLWLGPMVNVDMEIRILSVLSGLASIPFEAYDNNSSLNPDSFSSFKELGVDPIADSDWFHIMDFFMRPWFSSVWCIQELLLARQLRVLCGPFEISWHTIAQSLLFLHHTESLSHVIHRACLFGKLSKSSSKQVLMHTTTMLSVILCRQLINDRVRIGYEGLINIFRVLHTEDPRDHIFSLRALVTSAHVESCGLEDIKPDHAKTVQAVFIEVSSVITQTTQDLRQLSMVEDHSRRLIKGLPSWVPDFSVPLLPSPVRAAYSEQYNSLGVEDNGRNGPPRGASVVISKGNILTFNGTIVAAVAAVAAPFGEHDPLGFVTSVSDLAMLSQYDSSAQCDGGEALWRTLLMDHADGQRPAPATYGRALKYWLAHFLASSRANDDLTIYRRRKHHAALEAMDQLSRAIWYDGTVPEKNAMECIISVLGDRDNELFPTFWNNVQVFHEQCLNRIDRRRLFRTCAGLLGNGPLSIAVGDRICVASGADVPLVLRPLPNENFAFIGEAYVHGVDLSCSARACVKISVQ